jgi:AcrR family transcriptional regulator
MVTTPLRKATMGPGRQRRDRPLERQEIIDATLVLSRLPDRRALSARQLGERLNIDASAIYRHFAGMDDLFRAALDAIWLDAVKLIPRSLPWRARLETMGHVSLQMVVEHPGVGVEAYRMNTNGPGEQAAIDLVLACLEEAGLPDHEVVEFYAVLASTVLSHASAQAAWRMTAADPRLPAERPWIEPPSAPDPAAFPALARHVDGVSGLDHTQVFDLSLRVVLDVIESRVATPGT